MSTSVNNYNNYNTWIETLPFLLNKSAGSPAGNETSQAINTLTPETFSEKIEMENIAPSIVKVITLLNSNDFETLEKAQKIYHATHGFSTDTSETAETTVTSETIIKSFLQDPQVVKIMRENPEQYKAVIPSDEIVYISFGDEQLPLLFLKSFMEAKAPYLFCLLNSGMNEVVTSKDANGKVESTILQLDRIPQLEYIVKQIEFEIETGSQDSKITQQFIDSYKIEGKLNASALINDCFEFMCSDLIFDQFSKYLVYNDSPINEEFVSQLSSDLKSEKMIKERCEALVNSFRELKLLINVGDKPTDWQMSDASDADLARLETVLSRLEKLGFNFENIDLSIQNINTQLKIIPPTIAKYITKLKLIQCLRLTSLSLPKVVTLHVEASESLISIEAPKAQDVFLKYLYNLTKVSFSEVIKLSIEGVYDANFSIEAPKARDVNLTAVKLTSLNLPEALKLEINVADKLASIEAPKAQDVYVKDVDQLTSLNLPEALKLEINYAVKLNSIDAPKAQDIELVFYNKGNIKNLKSINAPKAKLKKTSLR